MLKNKRLFWATMLMATGSILLLTAPLKILQAQEITPTVPNPIAIIEPYARPGYLFDVQGFDNVICVYIDDAPFWRFEDYSPELSSRIGNNFSMVIDNTVVMREEDFSISHGFLVHLFPIPIYDQTENLIGTRNGVHQGCFSTEDFEAGFHSVTVSLGSLSAEQFTWIFKKGIISTETLATAVALPTTTPEALPRSVSITIEETLTQAEALNDSLFNAATSVELGREKITIAVDKSVNITCAESYDKEVTIDGVRITHENSFVIFGSSSGTCFISFDVYRISLGDHTMILKVMSKDGQQYEKSWKLSFTAVPAETPSPTP